MSRTIVTLTVFSPDSAADVEHALFRALDSRDIEIDSVEVRRVRAREYAVRFHIATDLPPFEAQKSLTAVLTRAKLLFADLEAFEPPLAPMSDVVDRVAAAIRSVIPVTGLEERVSERFDDEIGYFREGDWESFSERRTRSWEMRTQRAARAAIAAYMAEQRP